MRDREPRDPAANATIGSGTGWVKQARKDERPPRKKRAQESSDGKSPCCRATKNGPFRSLAEDRVKRLDRRADPRFLDHDDRDHYDSKIVAILANNLIQPGPYNNYVLAGNLCNAFALGSIGAADDFFLVGAEPPDESSYPLLTGTLLDSEGNVLFRLIRNSLTINPGHCSKIVGDHVGYEIHDSAGELVFKVETRFTQPQGFDEECWVTTLAGTFYDRLGNVVFRAHSGEEEHLEAHGKGAFGFSGGFGIVMGLTEPEVEVARVALMTQGSVHEVIKGELKDVAFDLDGKAIIDATVTNCTINISTGRWYLRGSTFNRLQVPV